MSAGWRSRAMLFLTFLRTSAAECLLFGAFLDRPFPEMLAKVTIPLRTSLKKSKKSQAIACLSLASRRGGRTPSRASTQAEAAKLNLYTSTPHQPLSGVKCTTASFSKHERDFASFACWNRHYWRGYLKYSYPSPLLNGYPMESQTGYIQIQIHL